MHKWDYIKFAMRLKEVERSVYAVPARNRRENVAEHSWSMAAIYWILKDDLLAEFPGINSEKVYEMIQLHDLVEIHAGDISTWQHKDKDTSKDARELAALDKILELLDENKAMEFKSLFTELEEKHNIEAKIVKGIDRISPAIQRVITGQGWKSENLPEEELDKIQLPRVQFSKTLTDLYHELKQEAKERDIL